MNDQEHILPPTNPLASRAKPDRLQRSLLASTLGVLVLFELPALFAGPTNPAWLAAVALIGPTVGIPAGITAFRRRNTLRAGAPAPHTVRP